MKEELTVIVSEDDSGVETYCPELAIGAYARTVEEALGILRERIFFSLGEPCVDLTWKLLYPDELAD